MSRTPISMRYDPDRLPDPPYVYGDHAATCMGCDDCLRAEDEYYRSKGQMGVIPRPCIVQREREAEREDEQFIELIMYGKPRHGRTTWAGGCPLCGGNHTGLCDEDIYGEWWNDGSAP